MMCWVAVDRALRLAAKRSFPADWNGWTSVRDEIYETIMKRGWNSSARRVRSAAGRRRAGCVHAFDAAGFFRSPTDPRMLRTIDAINRSPREGGLVSDGLVFRYDVEKTPDGLKGTEGTFNLCTFWLVEALTRARLRRKPPPAAGAPVVRTDDRVRQPSGPVCGADRPSGPGARKFSAGASLTWRSSARRLTWIAIWTGARKRPRCDKNSTPFARIPV